MDTNKILSASILDLIFDNRNKEYGAYELRKTYTKRIKRALFITAFIILLVYTGAVLANSLKQNEAARPIIKEVTLIDIPEDKPEPLPKQKIPEPQVQTIEFVEFHIVKDDIARQYST